MKLIYAINEAFKGTHYVIRNIGGYVYINCTKDFDENFMSLREEDFTIKNIKDAFDTKRGMVKFLSQDSAKRHLSISSELEPLLDTVFRRFKIDALGL